MKYKYTLLKQDETIEDLGERAEPMNFQELRKILDCDIIEIVHSDYYKDSDIKGVTCYGDEEGRFNEDNITNNHFKVLAPGWDVVGNIVKEVRL